MSWKQARKYFFILLLILLLLTLFACTNLYHRLEPPKIHIVKVEIKEVKPLESIYNMQLRVLNPNDISILVKGINCDLKINDNQFATGVSNAPTEIPAFGNSVLNLDVYSSALNFIRNLIALPGKETIKITFKGKLKLEGGSGMPSYLPFESEKEFSFKDLMLKSKGD